jgi:hypothetical protein
MFVISVEKYFNYWIKKVPTLKWQMYKHYAIGETFLRIM